MSVYIRFTSAPRTEADWDETYEDAPDDYGEFQYLIVAGGTLLVRRYPTSGDSEVMAAYGPGTWHLVQGTFQG